MESFSCVDGTVCSNPVKGSSGKYYSFLVKAESVSLDDESGMTLRCDASGRIKCLVPSPIVESLYPGKLYSSSSSGGIMVEIGEKIILNGALSRDGKSFIAEKAIQPVEKKNENEKGCSWLRRLMHLRSKLRLAFKRLMWSWGDAGGLILSLLCGSREYLQAGVQDSFKRAGLSHILALSGMHLSFFGGLAASVGKKMFGQRFAPLFSFIGIVLFVCFVGFTPSLTRSFIFSMTMLVASFSGFRNIKNLSVLSFVFLVHLLVKPGDIREVSFLLSYGALVGIFSLSDLLNVLLTPVIPPKTASGISASTGAQLATAPISACIFGEIMPVGIIASVVVSPMVSFFMTFSLAGIGISLCMPFLSNVFGDIMKVMYGLISGTVSVFALCPSVKF